MPQRYIAESLTFKILNGGEKNTRKLLAVLRENISAPNFPFVHVIELTKKIFPIFTFYYFNFFQPCTNPYLCKP